MLKFTSKCTQLALVAVLASSIGFSSSAKAESSIDQSEASFETGGIFLGQTVTNEYDLYKKFNSASDESLLKSGYSVSAIKAQRSVDFKAEIETKVEALQNESEKTLVNLGYTEEQIEDITDFKGTEEQLYALSASLAFSTYYGTSASSSSYSHINFRTDWTWSSAPVWLQTDAVAVPWSEEMYLDESSSYTYGKYDLHDEWNESYQQTVNVEVIPELNKGAHIEIDMGYHNNDVGGLYAKKGKFGYKLFKSALVKEVAIQPAYGHTFFNITGVSVSYPAGVSVDFGWTTSTEASEYIYKKL